MRRILAFLLVLIFPYISVGIAVRLAFTEAFVEWEYGREGFPKDRWGMSDEERLKLAKAGLRAVLSDEGFEEFRKMRLKNGHRAFTPREVKHMRDVKRLLEVYFPSVYILGVLWVLGVFYLREAKVLIFSGLFNMFLIVFLSLLVFSNYERAFEVFHVYVFDPYSWRFRDWDTLIRIYPMKFWEDATVFVGVVSFLIGFFVFLVGVVWERRGLRP